MTKSEPGANNVETTRRKTEKHMNDVKKDAFSIK